MFYHGLQQLPQILRSIRGDLPVAVHKAAAAPAFHGVGRVASLGTAAISHLGAIVDVSVCAVCIATRVGWVHSAASKDNHTDTVRGLTGQKADMREHRSRAPAHTCTAQLVIVGAQDHATVKAEQGEHLAVGTAVVEPGKDHRRRDPCGAFANPRLFARATRSGFARGLGWMRDQAEWRAGECEADESARRGSAERA